MNSILKDWAPPARPAHPRPHGAGVTKLRLAGEITTESAIEMFAAIRAAHNDTIELAVDSGGGSALGALGIFELLLCHPHRVVATIERASSGALLASLGADVRHILPDATVFLHETMADLSSASAAVLRDTLADVEHFNTLATAIIADACGQPRETVAQWRGAATRFNTHEAIAAGLAHEITSAPASAQHAG